MTFWAIVLIVLLILWLLLGVGVDYLPAQHPLRFGGTLIPWACVAILTYIVFGGALR